MAEYIEREALKQAIRDRFDYLFDRIKINSIVNEQPTADVVEVVRCKDCKYLHRMVCPYGIRRTPRGNDYCSYGKRREDER